MQWMIYGANGYTGEMIAREAKKRGLTPILAGRSASKIEPLSRELGLEHRTFGLDRPADVDAGLAGVGLVLHCAGPFSQTSAPMLEGCLHSRAHYLDITGEIPVFEYAHAQQQRAREAHVVLCPGVGFDVIPTDCIARALKDALPDATHLALGFDQKAVLSPGTPALQALIAKRIQGPDGAARDRMPSYVWGEATNAHGEKRTARIKTANGYSLTITGSLEVVQYLLQNEVPGGAYTPSMLMGPGLIAELPESGPMRIERQ